MLARWTPFHRTPIRWATVVAFWILIFPVGLMARGGGGCFLGDTLVTMADGKSKPISEIKPGDLVVAFTEGEKLQTAEVQKVIELAADSYYRIVTSQNIVVKATGEHPFYAGQGRYRRVKNLSVGDPLWIFGPTQLSDVSITAMRPELGTVKVYNLFTGEPHTFFANGIAVHNKGGGGGGGGGGGHGGGYYGGSGGRRNYCTSIADPVEAEKCRNRASWEFFIILMVFALPVAGSLWSKNLKGNLDARLSGVRVKAKADSTEALITELSSRRPEFNLERLRGRATSAFQTLQKCWESRLYSAMLPYTFPGIAWEHQAQLESMKRNHEINRIQDVNVKFCKFVHLRCLDTPAQAVVTALIEARMKDFYVDDRSQKYLRGDRSAETIQEFWTFQFQSGAWVLREITQVKEFDFLDEPNEVRMNGQVSTSESSIPGRRLTDVEKSFALLREDTGPVDLATLLGKSRLLAISMTAAYEKLEASAVRPLVSKAFFEKLNQHFTESKNAGIRREYRNLCVRYAEPLWCKTDKSGSGEFGVRVCLHAQIIDFKGTQVVRQDADVRPFDVKLWFIKEDGIFVLDNFEAA